ncbi:MAG TPA: radical SAM protein, partial [Candidatus Binatia bacterium]|nr:radical SAM protein [Candidatus Binatia bacterium]
MKVLLIQPPVQDFYDTDVRLQPIGLCYLKAAMKQHLPDVEVIVKDYHAGAGRQTVAIPKELRYLVDYYGVQDKSPFSTFHRFYHFGKSFDAIENEIAEIKPDVAGISSLFTPYFREVLEIAVRVKKRTSASVVIGGSHASAAPDSLLSSPHVDYVIRGEGEKALVEFLRHRLGRLPVEAVSNLAYKQCGKITYNPISDSFPIDEVPFPDLSDLSPSVYSLGGKPMTFMITSRSCPHKCSFCSVHTTFGTNYRRRSLENVLDEIELRYTQGYRVIDFEDDNLTYYKQTFKELCRRLIERFPHREMEFVAMNGISYLSLDNELLELMYRAGFSQLNLALVSSDKTVRETTKRPHTLESYVKVVSKAHQLGFKIVSYQILGLPNESLGSMIQTLAFNARLPVLLGASPFYQTPNAPIARGLELTEADYVKARLTALAIETENFSRDDIYTLFVTTRIINFLKGLSIEHDTALDELMNRSWPDSRATVGFELLRQLQLTGRWYAWTKTGSIENAHVRSNLLRRVLSQIEEITTQEGPKISVRDFARGLSESYQPCASGTVTRKAAPVVLD